MGYQTFVVLEIIEFDSTKKNKHASGEEALQAIMEKTNPCDLEYENGDTSASFSDNRGHDMDEIIALSKDDPGLLLEADIDGTIEDSNDRRNMRIRNGKTETYHTVLKYATFSELTTEEERMALNKAEKTCNARKDLANVAKSIADAYGNPAAAPDLYNVMAMAAKEYLLELRPSE